MPKVCAAGARKVRNEYVPVEGSKSEGATRMVYVPPSASVLMPGVLQMGESKMIVPSASVTVQRGAHVPPVDEVLMPWKNTRAPAAAVKVYTSTAPTASMFPAPAAGTPFEMVSPTLIANSCAGGARYVRNEYVPVAEPAAATVIV
jgi:hypothetical protein